MTHQVSYGVVSCLDIILSFLSVFFLVAYIFNVIHCHAQENMTYAIKNVFR